MRIALALAVLAAALTTGCGRAADPPAAAGTTTHTLTVDGRTRTYRVHVPASVAGKSGLPVVIVLHGGGGNGEIMERQSHFSTVADRAGFLAVYPDGTAGVSDRILLTWNAGTCCGYARDHGVDDVAFVAALLDALARGYRTDPGRVYVTGFSNGAMLAYRLGCELAGRITAIAPVSGALNVDGCRPARPLPVLAIHGTADRNVPYGGGPPAAPPFPGAGSWTNRSVADSVGFWARVDGCPATPATSRDGTVEQASYAPCAPGLDVTLLTIDGGGHAWPGGTKGRAQADEPAPVPDASAVIWDFFARHA